MEIDNRPSAHNESCRAQPGEVDPEEPAAPSAGASRSDGRTRASLFKRLHTLLVWVAVVFLAGLVEGALSGVRNWPDMPEAAARYFAQRALPDIARSLCFSPDSAAETGVSRDEASDTWTFHYTLALPRLAGSALDVTISRHGVAAASTSGAVPGCAR